MATAEKTELVRRVEERVTAELVGPVRRAMGDGTPAERTALEVVKIVGEVEQELAGRWITLQEAVERTGWSYDTLVRRAKAITSGERVDASWAGMQVRKTDSGQYEVQAGSVPHKPGTAAA